MAPFLRSLSQWQLARRKATVCQDSPRRCQMVVLGPAWFMV
jgi:hypothetical protein